MKKLFALVFIVVACIQEIHSQQRLENYKRNLRQLEILGEDTNRVKALNGLAVYHRDPQPDSGIYYASQALSLARKLHYPSGELAALRSLCWSHGSLGNLSNSMKIDFEIIKLAKQYHDPGPEGTSLESLGDNFAYAGQTRIAIKYYLDALRLIKRFDRIGRNGRINIDIPFIESYLARCYAKLNMPDSSQLYMNEARQDAKNGLDFVFEVVYGVFGETFLEFGRLDSALFYQRESYRLNKKRAGLTQLFPNPPLRMATVFHAIGARDSAVFYAKQSLTSAQKNKLYEIAARASRLLSQLYSTADSIRHFSSLAFAYTDSLNQLRNQSALQDVVDFDEQQKQYELDLAQKEYESKMRTSVFIGSILLLLVIVFFVYRNSRQKHKAKQQIEKAYDQLKSTQSQLIQSEKMASLGELTAGIAHEIQNPLNFVNNFSEVNIELLTEMKDEMEKGNIEDAKSIVNDAIENQNKINHHGKRADAIVKGMLQHSRSSSGQKEPTDINALCDEYLRLAYHGIRARDKSFHAKFETDFDDSLEKINLVPQDIGRVILNLVNNAFYAVHEKAKQHIAGYDPMVTVSTKKINGKVEIRVADNGNGIPVSVKEKIFQPFFTTKPTGQGTGLGLSLSYDMVKVHGGELKVETKEGEGSTFIMQIPTK